MDVAYLQTQIGRVFTQYISRNYKKTLKKEKVYYCFQIQLKITVFIYQEILEREKLKKIYDTLDVEIVSISLENKS
jgi:hypothetical protein